MHNSRMRRGNRYTKILHQPEKSISCKRRTVAVHNRNRLIQNKVAHSQIAVRSNVSADGTCSGTKFQEVFSGVPGTQ